MLVFKDAAFEFHAYCPITDPTYLQKLNYVAEDLPSGGAAPDIYVVYIKAKSVKTPEGNSSMALTYCGLARPWLGTC